ncbi:signal peptidase I [Leptospira ryugenii]|uniref:Signal peptidase I n=1 Tax=Leptospira ryugenii TaxID=1917863 RepID=A0A2P2DVU7_9LEPT|nr:signal peptidase I [Leptospira ryugenii]GBF48756.1 signal peptidase I [Leptospira ryugenii]
MSRSKQKISWKDRAFQIGIPLGVSLILIQLVKLYVFTPLKITNDFMAPTFAKDDTVYINRIFRKKNLLVGDVVLIRSPKDSRQFILARILGKGSDAIEIQNRKAFRNGELVNPSLFPEPKETNLPILPKGKSDTDHMDKVFVPARHVFVLADNREIGVDSRDIGTISEDLIVGKVW